MVECEVCGVLCATDTVMKLGTAEGEFVYVCQPCVVSRKREMGAEYQVRNEGENFLQVADEEEVETE